MKVDMGRNFSLSFDFFYPKALSCLGGLTKWISLMYNKVIRYLMSWHLPFPKRQILDSSKLKEFADDNFKFDGNGRKFSKRVENTVGKGTCTADT